MSDSDAKPATAQPARPRSAPTIYDIAKLAGVNPSTVSRALNQPGRISSKTEKRVHAAAHELNYRVNPIARALPTGRTKTLGLIIADITNPMFFGLMRGAERAAARHGYTLLLAESQESQTREAQATHRVAPMVDGMILLTTRLTDERIRALADDGPLVMVNRAVDDIPAIVPELGPGIDHALQHLNELGHTSIAYLSGPATSWMSQARWDRLFEQASSLGMHIVEIGPRPPTLISGRDALRRVLAANVTAVIAYNDLMAIGLLQAAQEHGVQVPGELSIIGFDNIFGTDFTSPPLSTIAVPLDRIGELAVLAALDLIGTGRAAAHPPLAEADLKTTLIVRSSTGPAPSGPPSRNHAEDPLPHNRTSSPRAGASSSPRDGAQNKEER